MTALLCRPDGSVGGVFASTSPASTSSCSPAPSFSRPAIPTACTRARPAPAKCPATASRWHGGPARRSSISKCSGGTPTTWPIRRAWQRMQVYPNPMLGSEKSARMVNSQARSSSTSSRTIRWPMGPIPSSSRRWRRRCMPGGRATTAAISPASITATRRRSMPTRPMARAFRQLGLRFPKNSWKRRSRALPARRHRCRYATMGSSVPGFTSRAGSAAQQRSHRACDLRWKGRRRWRCGAICDSARGLRSRRNRREPRRLERLCATQRRRRHAAQVKEKIRAMMWEKVGVEKDAAACVGAGRYRELPARPPAAHGGQERHERSITSGSTPSTPSTCSMPASSSSTPRSSARKAAARSCGAIFPTPTTRIGLPPTS